MQRPRFWRQWVGAERSVRPYAGALALVVVAACAALLLGSERGAPSTLLLFAVVVCGALGGLGPALLAAAWGFAALSFFFEEPVHALPVTDPRTFLNGALFVTTAFVTSALRRPGTAAQPPRTGRPDHALPALDSPDRRGGATGAAARGSPGQSSADADLVTVAGRMVQQLAKTTPRRRIVLQTDVESLPAQWDESSAENLLRRLLAEALQTSPDGSTIRVVLFQEGGPFGRAVIQLHHDGGPSRTDTCHMADVVEVVERHGGSVRTASPTGAGTTVRVLLPLRRASASPERAHR